MESYDNNSSNWSSKSREDHNPNASCAGIGSTETQTNNVRMGFEFIDLITNDKRVLASITWNGPKVGKYFVHLYGCSFAAERLTNAIATTDVIICDEIGPMGLKSREFTNSVKNLLHIDKKAIVVVHQKLKHPLIDEFRNVRSIDRVRFKKQRKDK